MPIFTHLFFFPKLRILKSNALICLTDTNVKIMSPSFEIDTPHTSLDFPTLPRPAAISHFGKNKTVTSLFSFTLKTFLSLKNNLTLGKKLFDQCRKEKGLAISGLHLGTFSKGFSG